MKRIFALSLSLLAATLSFALDSKPNQVEPPTTPRLDTGAFRARFDSLRQNRDTGRPLPLVDTAAFHHAGEVRDTSRVGFGDHLAKADSIRDGMIDTAKAAEFRTKMDSLRHDWTAKRDSQISKIKDPLVQASLRDRVKRIEAKRVEVKAKIAQKKAELKATKPVEPVAPAAK